MFTKRQGEKTKPVYPELRVGELCITWIGHASFLVQTPEHSILIDPNWAKWLKVIKRLRQPGLEIHDLPAIDLVLVTHAHFDHLDRKTLRAVASDQAIVVPEHVGGLVHGLGFNQVRELRQWEKFEIGDLKVTLTPALHWGARVLHDSHRGFGGFHMEYAGRSVFHCGDSAWFEGFTEIGERLPVEIALLPIGAYEAPTKRDVHMNPEQAIDAFLQLKARTFVPMHFGTFRLSYEPLHEPPERLIRHGAARQLIDCIRILKEGEPTIF
jgi:L-ascorbate metabolism protein UlaG (beta-lactamase superfamily)